MFILFFLFVFLILRVPKEKMACTTLDLGKYWKIEKGVEASKVLDSSNYRQSSLLFNFFLSGHCVPIRLPWWLSSKRMHLQFRRCRFNPWFRKIPFKRKWQPTQVSLSGKFHGQRSLVGYSPWGHKESYMTEQLSMCIYYITTETVFSINMDVIFLIYWYVHS